MGYFKVLFVLFLYAAYFTICHSQPNRIGNSDISSLFHRQANESAGITKLHYSPSWFNTKSRASLFKSAQKVDARTRALIFSPTSTLLEDTLESNDTSRLGNFLDQIFANDLVSDDVRALSSRQFREGAPPEEPPDPIRFEEHNWAMNFGGYDLQGDKVSSYVLTSVALMSYAQIGTDMIVNLRTPLSNYPNGGYRQDLYPPGADRALSFILDAASLFFYEDVMMSLKLFISWTATWYPENERKVPSTSMVLYKRDFSASEVQIASGRLVLRGS